MNNKALTLLGFAAKAGKLSYGFDSVTSSLKQKKAQLVITADDISQKTLKEATYFARKSGITVLVLKGVDIQTLTKAIGRKCGIVSVNEKQFAESLKEEILNDQ